MSDVAEERMSRPPYSFTNGRQLRDSGDFLIRYEFVPVDAEHPPLVRHMKGLQFCYISFQQCPCL